MRLNIIETDWGIASRTGKDIFVNRSLKKYPGLYGAIINHERKHTIGWTLGDFMLDIKDPNLLVYKGDYYKFLFTHPKAWAQFIPIWKYKGKWSIDISLIMVLLLCIILLIFAYKIIIW